MNPQVSTVSLWRGFNKNQVANFLSAVRNSFVLCLLDRRAQKQVPWSPKLRIMQGFGLELREKQLHDT